MEREPEQRSGVTRRQFLAGLSAGAAAASLPFAKDAVAAGEKEEAIPTLGPGPAPVEFVLNRKRTRLLVEPRVTLLDALRDHLGVTGPKRACDRGACGACTVLLDGLPVNACMLLAADAAGREVVTIEGLTPDQGLSPLQASFVECDALQCGFCTPGMVTVSEALLRAKPKPTLDDVKAALAGNLCRCGTYPRVVEAVLRTARER